MFILQTLSLLINKMSWASVEKFETSFFPEMNVTTKWQTDLSKTFFREIQVEGRICTPGYIHSAPKSKPILPVLKKKLSREKFSRISFFPEMNVTTEWQTDTPDEQVYVLRDTSWRWNMQPIYIHSASKSKLVLPVLTRWVEPGKVCKISFFAETHILKARVLEVRTPQIIWTFRKIIVW